MIAKPDREPDYKEVQTSNSYDRYYWWAELVMFIADKNMVSTGEFKLTAKDGKVFAVTRGTGNLFALSAKAQADYESWLAKFIVS